MSTASSSAADADNATVPDPAAQPYSAFDGDPRDGVALGTRQPSGGAVAAGHLRPRPVGRRGADQPAVRHQRRDHRCHRHHRQRKRAQRPFEYRNRCGADRTDDLSAPDCRPGERSRPYAQVAITALTIPGLTVHRTIVMPRDMPAGTPVNTISMSAQPSRANCVIDDAKPVCALGLDRAGEDVAGLDRTFTLKTAGTYGISATATPSPGGDLDALIARFADYPVRATANASELPDPLAGPQAAVGRRSEHRLDRRGQQREPDTDPSLAGRQAHRQPEDPHARQPRGHPAGHPRALGGRRHPDSADQARRHRDLRTGDHRPGVPAVVEQRRAAREHLLHHIHTTGVRVSVSARW